MANWLTSILGGGVGELAEKIGGVVDRFKLTDDEKAQFELATKKLLIEYQKSTEETLRSEIGAKERIMIAELEHGDTYTKRARPTVVYGGLVLMAWNYSLVPLFAWLASTFVSAPIPALPELALPEEFWYAWGSVVSMWSIGRSFEKRGISNKVTNALTGNGTKKPSILEE